MIINANVLMRLLSVVHIHCAKIYRKQFSLWTKKTMSSWRKYNPSRCVTPSTSTFNDIIKANF